MALAETSTSSASPKTGIGLNTKMLVYILASITVYGVYLFGYPTHVPFLALCAVTLLMHVPAKLLSPMTILHLYYGAWFVVAPLIAGKYAGKLALPEYNLSFAFAYSVYGLSALAIEYGEQLGLRAKLRASFTMPDISRRNLLVLIAVLYVTSTAAVCAIVLRTGGFEHWLSDPGQAFLNRGGSGAFVILSHFSSLALAISTAYAAHRDRRLYLVALFLGWVVLTAAVHGSKLQIFLLVLLSITPWAATAKFWSRWLPAFLIGGAIIFFAGMFLRHQDILSSIGSIISTANYFTALENLAISIRDLSPGFLETFFLPFNKIGIHLGLASPDAYYDMNHFLTDRYYPERWAMRATEQWPVETDLYLNFWFFGGLPLIAVFFGLHGWLYGYAQRVNTVGAWFAVVMLSVAMISHLRGSLYNHVDFHLYPYVLVMFFLLGGWKWPAQEDVAKPRS